MDAMHPLDETNEHFDRMYRDTRWLRYRAILNAFEEDGEKEAFLPSADFEAENNVGFRRSISHFQGVSPEALDQLFGAVFGTDPVLRSDVPETQAFIEDCFPGGLLAYLEANAIEVAGMGVGFIHVDAVVDGDSVEEPANAAQETRPTPVLRFIPAEQVDNWDDAPDPKWVKTRRVVKVQDSPTEKPKYYVERWVIEKERTLVYRKEITESQSSSALAPGKKIPGKYELISTINHRLGRLPLVPWVARPVGHGRFTGESFIKDSSRFDISNFNVDSWQQMAVYRHAHPLLTYSGDEQPESIPIGPNGLTYLPPNSELAYVGVPIETFDARESILDRTRVNARTAAGIANETADAPSSDPSGVSLKVRWTTRQKKNIDAFARTTERAAREIIEIADLYLSGGREPRGGHEASFSSTHELQEPREFIRDFQAVDQDIPSDTFRRMGLLKIARMLHPDASEDQAEAMQNEIMGNPLPEPDELPLT